jgi:beta-lactamase regulating signal transducer with metallopeptidase domain
LNFFIMLLICSITVSMVAIAFYLLSPVLRRYSAKCQYFTWIIIIIAFIIPFRPVFDYRAYLSIQPTVTTQTNLSALISYSHRVGETVSQSSNIFWGFLDYRLIIGIWVAGFFATSTYHVIRHILFIKSTRHCSEGINNTPMIAEVLQRVSAEMEISKQMQVQICPLIASPLMTGFFSPKILLPTGDFSSGELAFIFKHELTHYKRKDLWWKALALLATAIHWFNPVVYLTYQAANLQCELSCDKEVIYRADRDTRQQYSGIILRIIQHNNKLQPALFTEFYNGKTETEKRISAILNTRKRRSGISVMVGTILCIILIGTVFSGYMQPSMRYFERKWETNTHWNEQIYKSEPKGNANAPADNFPFMGTIKISYFFHAGQTPPWLDKSGNYQVNVSAYDAVVMKGIDFSNQSEADAFAYDQLLTKYYSMENKGFSDKKPKQTEYAYKIEVPENLENDRVTNFYNKSDSSTLSKQIYVVSYTQGEEVFMAYFTPEYLKLLNQDIDEVAQNAVEDFAKKNDMTLPKNYQNHIQISQN